MPAIAFVADSGSGVAFVFDDWGSAVRGLDGTWRSPAPASKVGDFMDEYTTASPADALALSKEARIATLEFPPSVEFFDVEGIPVTLGNVPGVKFSCAAWDKAEPRVFDPVSARRNGAPISEQRFRELFDEYKAVSQVGMKEKDNAMKRANLQRAIEIAVSAHKNQIDKAGSPYILHPIRVMMSLCTEEERIVGVLHDVVEDTDWTIKLLRKEGFSQTVLDALQSVTIMRGENYEEFIRRASQNTIGRKVKIADLNDNMDLKRILKPNERDFERMKKYAEALNFLRRDESSTQETSETKDGCPLMTER